MNEVLNDNYFFLGKPQWDQPIGGKIKSKPEDFRVIELNNDKSRLDENWQIQNSGGLFLSGCVRKRGIDHGRMIKIISEIFDVSENDVSTSGLKDANAVTYQRFSVFKPKAIPLDPLNYNEDIQISHYSFQREKVYPGSMGGNYFEIKIIDCQPNNINFQDFNSYLEMGIINYYGYQRFGSIRPISSQVGRLLANSAYKHAIDVFLGGKSFGDDESFRKLWRDNQDPNQLLKEWIGIPSLERTVLEYLIDHNSDYKGAISRIPKYLKFMYSSAFISELTNSYLTKRGSTSNVLKGERRIQNNIEIALPSQKWQKPLNDVWQTIFEEKGISIVELRKIRHTTRNLLLFATEFTVLDKTNNTVTLSFKLNNGCYATTLLRELMHSNPLNFV